MAEGLSLTSGLSIGVLTFLISLAVLLLWIPLKQKAGIGTVLNVIIIAAVIEWSLPYLPHPETYLMQTLQAILGTLVVGFASGIYLIANLDLQLDICRLQIQPLKFQVWLVMFA